MKAVIVEDEIKNQKFLASIISSEHPEVSIDGMYKSINEAVDGIRKTTPDLIFLDIQLEDGTGFELLQRLDKIPHVIFITAYDEYALQAFKFSAVDYLMKPIDTEELNAAIAKVPAQTGPHINQSITNAINNYFSKNKDPFITIPTVSDITYVKVSEVIRLEGQGAYCNIICEANRKYLLSKTLKDFEQLLEPYGFLRIHQSHIINLNFIAKYDRGDQIVHLSNSDTIPISRKRKELFIQAMTSITL